MNPCKLWIGASISCLIAMSLGTSLAQDGFNIGETNFKIGGFVDVDAQYIDLDGGSFPSNSVARDFLIPGATPVGGDASAFTDFSAESSRVFLQTRRKAGNQVALGHVELDFYLSGQGNERVSNSIAPRLRRAFVDYGGFRVGQEWTTFMNTSAIAESATFYSASDGAIFVRQVIIRYTNGPFQIALENPSSTIVGAANHPEDDSIFPDLIGRYNLKGDFGNISVAGLLRQIRDRNGTETKDALGWGASVAGKIKALENTDIRFSATYGSGIGRYVGLNSLRSAAFKADGNLETLTSYGGHAAVRYAIGPGARVSVGASFVNADLPSYIADTTTRNTWSAFAAIITDVAPKLSVGAQVEYGVRTLKNESTGRIFRTTVSARYGF